MLIIKLWNGTHTHTWNIGEPHPTHGSYLMDATSVEATGAEMEYVMARFQNIPLAKTNKQIWVGDFAKFIFANLCDLPEQL